MKGQLQLENFRGVKNGRIELSPLTILLGPNNSAKTTMLEALFLLPNPFRQVPYLSLLPPQNQSWAVSLLEELHGTLDSRGFAFLLYKYVNPKGLIQLTVNGSKYSLGISKIESSKSIVFTTENPTRAQRQLEDGSTKYTYGDVYLEHTQLQVNDYTTVISGNSLLLAPRLLKNAFEYIRRNWATITNLGVTKKVAEEAAAISHEKYEDFTIEPYFGGALALNAYLKGGLRIRLGDIGEGLQSYIVSRILFEVANPKILLWDDLESHLNPRILHRIAEWTGSLIAEDRMVVVSTHSLEAAKILAGFNEEAAAIHLTYLDKGELRTRSISFSEMEELSSKGIDVRVAEDVLL